MIPPIEKGDREGLSDNGQPLQKEALGSFGPKPLIHQNRQNWHMKKCNNPVEDWSEKP